MGSMFGDYGFMLTPDQFLLPPEILLWGFGQIPHLTKGPPLIEIGEGGYESGPTFFLFLRATHVPIPFEPPVGDFPSEFAEPKSAAAEGEREGEKRERSAARRTEGPLFSGMCWSYTSTELAQKAN